ncbi:MAG: ATP-binding cassette domain-containing protein, partial [Verrucomicrobiota bacterium]
MPDLVLQARGLAKSFASPAGPLPVLTDVSLEVFAGESVSIRGSSGSGKTTLLQQIGGLDQPDAGEVRILAPGAGLVAPRASLGRGRSKASMSACSCGMCHLPRRSPSLARSAAASPSHTRP